MNLAQYMNQVTPARFPQVRLAPGEYKVVKTTKIGVHTYKTIIIEMDSVPFEYVQVNDEPQLMTTDEHGNPRYRSVFHIFNHPDHAQQ